jgi:hypothetical protein
MNGTNDFWVALHHLASAYSREGKTPNERFGNVVDQFRRMSPIARHELLAEFGAIASELTNVFSACNAAHHAPSSDDAIDDRD